jgi:hypothetical protein
MICALEHISRNTCELVNQATIQSALQTEIRDDMDAVRDLSEIAQPRAALERQRLQELRAEIERCCPPEVQPPACAYEPCPRPDRIPPPDLPEIPTPDRPPG